MNGTAVQQDWRAFVIEYGAGARCDHLAHIVGRSADEIRRFRARVACAPRRGPAPLFQDLFSLWHGRPPRDDDWPAPARFRRSYEWQGPDFALLGRLIGRHGFREIAEILTARLRSATGDPDAVRTLHSVHAAAQRIGLQSTDVVGGVTLTQAAREVGSFHSLYAAVASGELPARRSGRLYVIARADLDVPSLG